MKIHKSDFFSIVWYSTIIKKKERKMNLRPTKLNILRLRRKCESRRKNCKKENDFFILILSFHFTFWKKKVCVILWSIFLSFLSLCTQPNKRTKYIYIFFVLLLLYQTNYKIITLSTLCFFYFFSLSFSFIKLKHKLCDILFLSGKWPYFKALNKTSCERKRESAPWRHQTKFTHGSLEVDSLLLMCHQSPSFIHLILFLLNFSIIFWVKNKMGKNVMLSSL